ncbi:hypothetical protein HYW44_04185 [Candidatus Daviesbacteria bacterium]|nr:hypothetical protein [Candidatus Daviesbacteria bacterium]
MSVDRSLRYEYWGGITDSTGRLTYRNGGRDRYLFPCQRVTDPDVLVGLLAYNQMQPKRFIPTHRDWQPITITLGEGETAQKLSLAYPGKSAFLYFEGVPTQEIVGALVNASLQRVKERTDHLHLSTVGWIEEAGWQVWWTPLPERNHWLHARVVPNSVVERGQIPTLEEATALREVFIKAL